MKTMQGCPEVPFSKLIADTINTHGVVWADRYYVRNGMTRKEFRMWAKAVVLGGVA